MQHTNIFHIFTPSTQSLESKKLVIIILASSSEIQDEKTKPILSLPLLTVKHARKHANLDNYKGNTSVLIVSDNAALLDLTKLSVDKDLIIDRNDLSQAIKNLQSLSYIVPLPKEKKQFTKALIIGDMEKLSPEVAQNLSNFNMENMKNNALIRIQICNFSKRQILDNNLIEQGNFVDKIIPPFCRLSIPNTYSVISDKDIRAIDLDVGYRDFNLVKTKLSNMLIAKNTIETFPEKINNMISTFTNLKKLEDTVENIKIIFEDGNEYVISPSEKPIIKNV